MRTADLTGALLDYWVARAEGVPAAELEIRKMPRPGDPRTPDTICVRSLRSVWGPVMAAVSLPYSTNWALTGPLLEKHGILLGRSENEWLGVPGEEFIALAGDTALVAICRAVVRAAFGDEVEDLPCA